MPSLAKNKKALFDYHIIKEYEAGIVLVGHEVKSAKLGQISLKGSFVKFLKGEPFLVNARISPYQKANLTDLYDPERSRKLLLSKKEIDELKDKRQAEGLAIIPLGIYTKKSLVKVKIALARGKKKYDKREAIKKRDVEKKIKNNLNY